MRKIISAINLIRAVTIGLGIGTLAVGYYSHFASAWTEFNGNKTYSLCNDLRDAMNLATTCPRISMEWYFLSAATIALILLLADLAAVLVVKSNFMNNVDLGYYVLGTLLLISAGILYIISAERIENFFEDLRAWVPFPTGLMNPKESPYTPFYDQWEVIFPEGFKLRRVEKLVAGGLAIGNGILHAVEALLIATR